MSVLEAMIGWLTPPTCVCCGSEGQSLCMACSSSEVIPHGSRCYRCSAITDNYRTCKKCRLVGSPHSVWITTDYDGAAKDLVQKYKFGQQRVASQVIANLMVETFLSFNSDEIIRDMNYLVIPIPTATSRVRERGFDHSAYLARHIANRLKLEYYKGLGRLGQERQMGSKRAQRLKQPGGSYFLRHQAITSNRNILLIDDVVTTGSTLKAATQILRSAGARRVDALAFAKRL